MILIILQFGISIVNYLSPTQKTLLWGFIILSIILFIYFLYRRTDKIISAKKQSQEQVVAPVQAGEITDEEAAAITLAIHMFKREMHDMESLTITLKKVSKVYSPWSSKIYTLRQNPR